MEELVAPEVIVPPPVIVQEYVAPVWEGTEALWPVAPTVTGDFAEMAAWPEFVTVTLTLAVVEVPAKFVTVRV
jgi:hypothetical protein